MPPSVTQTIRKTAATPPGFLDRDAFELKCVREMILVIQDLWELHSFEMLDTPIVEYTEALGKFLPDQDRPGAGVFSWQDADEHWLSLRYDLTAPLARFAAQNWNTLPKPYRNCRIGWVFRDEKPGLNRFRQFMQCDADILGVDSVMADAELFVLMAKTLEAIGCSPMSYEIRVNNRKTIDGLLFSMEPNEEPGTQSDRRLRILRGIDKLERLGIDGVTDLLGPGRMDESGDFTEGAKLRDPEIAKILLFLEAGTGTEKCSEETISTMEGLIGDNPIGREGISELRQMHEFVSDMGYSDSRFRLDPSVVRGLDYYTGLIYEANLLTGKDRLSSVGGGGRYNGLVTRFLPQVSLDDSAASGFSIGISRLFSILNGPEGPTSETRKLITGPVIIAAVEPSYSSHYQELATRLRQAGIKTEVYLGTSSLKSQMKYADRKNSPCVVLRGKMEMQQGIVQIKDLALGKELSKQISSNQEWRADRPAQISIHEDRMVEAVEEILAR